MRLPDGFTFANPAAPFAQPALYKSDVIYLVAKVLWSDVPALYRIRPKIMLSPDYTKEIAPAQQVETLIAPTQQVETLTVNAEGTLYIYSQLLPLFARHHLQLWIAPLLTGDSLPNGQVLQPIYISVRKSEARTVIDQYRESQAHTNSAALNTSE